MEEGIDFEFVPTDYAQSAANSPTKKVPFLEADGVKLTDSTTIVHWARMQNQKPSIATVDDMNLYATANTVLDTAINIYLLEKDNVVPSNVPYLARQSDRITSCLNWLDDHIPAYSGNPTDGQLRVACLLDWARYRDRFDFSAHANLQKFYEAAQDDVIFQETAPPPA